MGKNNGPVALMSTRAIGKELSANCAYPAPCYIPITIATVVVPDPPMLRVAIFRAPSIW